jgi:hypothetical protein
LGLNRHNQVWVTLWCLITTPPLVLLLVLTWFTLTHQPQRVNTGDALLDAYLQAAVDNNVIIDVARCWNDYGETSHRYSLPAEQWQDLEQRFGGDPRYWMLRCYYETQQDSYTSQIAGVDIDSRLHCLEQARERGHADWMILFRLVQAYEQAWSIQASDKLRAVAPAPGSKATQKQKFAYRHKLRQEVDHRHGLALQQLLTELKNCGNDQALVHYMLARIECERGNYAGAISELRAGNAAPRRDSGTGYPYNVLRQTAAQGLPLAGDRLLAGCLERWYYDCDAQSYLDYVGYKDAVRILSSQAAGKHDLVALRVLHSFSCRFGSLRGAPLIQAMVGTVMESIVRKAIPQSNQHSTPQSQQALAEAQRLHSELLKEYKSINSNSPFNALFKPSLAISSPGYALRSYATRLLGGIFFSLSENEAWCDSLLMEQQGLATVIAPDFAQLEQLQLWD